MSAPLRHLPGFLIDENLSPVLAAVAHERGFGAIHVNHLGTRMASDLELLRVVEERSLTLVTNNAIEFRGRYRRIALHPGVVFLLPAVRREGQVFLFTAALDAITADPRMTNVALDLRFGVDGRSMVRRYDLP